MTTLLNLNASAFEIKAPKNWNEYLASKYLNGRYVYDLECNGHTDAYIQKTGMRYTTNFHEAFIIKEEVRDNGRLIITQDTVKTSLVPRSTTSGKDFSSVTKITEHRIDKNRLYTTENETTYYYNEYERAIMAENYKTETIHEMTNGSSTLISTKIYNNEEEQVAISDIKIIADDPFYTSYTTITTKKSKNASDGSQDYYESTSVCNTKMLGIDSYIDLIPRVIIGKWTITDSFRYETIQFLKNKTFFLKKKNSDEMLKGSYDIEEDKILFNFPDGLSSYHVLKFRSMIDLEFGHGSDDSPIRFDKFKKIVE
ncbi:hypothetical protein M899_1058 [Bacteriovorax sp. BSW11_IV]|nr:hypothetical protein M899_1058 [Bacteriovorax sp. BSW11_IV]